MSNTIDLRGKEVDADESSNITVDFSDLIDGDLSTADFLTLRFMIVTYDDTATEITADTDILNAGPGVVADDANGKAILTLRLEPADNIISGTIELDETEDHEIQIVWTFNDGVANRTGRANVLTRIKPRAT